MKIATTAFTLMRGCDTAWAGILETGVAAGNTLSAVLFLGWMDTAGGAPSSLDKFPGVCWVNCFHPSP